MATNNPIDSLDPIQVALGGLGTSTLTADGVLYGNGTAAVGVTSVGTSGQVLTSNGSGMAPTFQAASSGGTMVLLQTLTASGGTSLQFTSIGSYSNYMIRVSILVDAYSGPGIIGGNFSTDNGATWLSNNYQSRSASFQSTGATNGTLQTTNQLIWGFVTTSPTYNYANIFLQGMNTVGYPSFLGNFSTSSTGYVGNFISGYTYCIQWATSGAITANAIQLITTGSSFTSGTASLYGITS